ncbi:MAG: hypothetical protein ACRDZY_01205 [Acidimicrobiales bacterium]
MTSGTGLATGHVIEEAVRVYLRLGANGWEIDPTTVDGGALFTDYDRGPLGCEATRVAAGRLNLPDGQQLRDLLIAATGPAPETGP